VQNNCGFFGVLSLRRKRGPSLRRPCHKRRLRLLSPRGKPLPRAPAPQPQPAIKVTALSPQQESALKPKDSFKECDACPEMVVTPAGSFMMGARDYEVARVPYSAPQHAVTFAKPFAVGRFAVTFDEWDACVADGGCNGYRPWDRDWGRGRRPVIHVSWSNAQSYMAWLSRKTGKTYRLLTEAEREYVTRAGTSTAFWWGDSIWSTVANYDNRQSDGGRTGGTYRQQTIPVDNFAPNPWGLFQVHGNVGEWVEDCYHNGYLGAPTDGSAWTTGDCIRRAIRGGSWQDGSLVLHSAFRSFRNIYDSGDGNGFRVARDLLLEPTPSAPAPQSKAVPLTDEQERALKPKDSFKECDVCPEVVATPAGSFIMGSPDGESDRAADEGPQHAVNFAKPFTVGRFAVTFDEWDACVADAGCGGYRPSDQGWGRGRRPVINVSWDDAMAYVAWLSRKTGKTYRLLSEAEREYVTRAGSTSPFWWGDAISTDQANYDGRFAFRDGMKGERRLQTMPVDSFSANPWGFYQVHGNVWEWVEDCYHNNYLGAPHDGSAWIGAGCFSSQVIRGGYWDAYPRNLRSGQRNAMTSARNNQIGFRVARALLVAERALVPAASTQPGNLANPAALNEPAPPVYKARFETSKGSFVVEVHRDWAPNGADRFFNLVKNRFYDDTRFFRVISGFMVQFGINGDPKISAPWRMATISDDPVKQSNKRGYVSFATSGPNSRTSQVFINFADNAGLDRQGFAPFGQVISGMDVVDGFYSGYGEGAPSGRGPQQGRIQREGNAYLEKDFSNLDHIKKATLEK
jgi:formylglycine-generating enzyme required for sulfatase activity/cyclophilin family peptidyl-prolyl cis-trans isomerase